MKAAFHKYVKINIDLSGERKLGKRAHYLHVVERADGMNLYFATDGMGWALNVRQTMAIVNEYKAGNFENSEENLAYCPAYL